MSNALAKKEETAVTAVPGNPKATTVLKSDVLVPKLLLMQALSDNVTMGLKNSVGQPISPGQIVRSTSREVMGDATKPVEILPLQYRNDWMLQEKIGDKFEFRGFEPRTAKNEDLPWDYTNNGVPWRRVKVLTLLALLPGDIEKEEAAVAALKKDPSAGFDINQVLLPVAISFQKTSFMAGRMIATHFAKVNQMARYGIKPYSSSLYLTCRLEKNDKGVFHVYGVEMGRKTEAKAFVKASEWEETLGQGNVEIDNSDVASGENDVSQGAF